MSSTPYPIIRKAQKVQGRTLIFRNAKEKDAEFILKLCTESQKSRYLSETEPIWKNKKLGLTSTLRNVHKIKTPIRYLAARVGADLSAQGE